MHKLYLLDLGMFGEKWICGSCRKEYYSHREVLEIREVPDDPQTLHDTCRECWV